MIFHGHSFKHDTDEPVHFVIIDCSINDTYSLIKNTPNISFHIYETGKIIGSDVSSTRG